MAGALGWLVAAVLLVLGVLLVVLLLNQRRRLKALGPVEEAEGRLSVKRQQLVQWEAKLRSDAAAEQHRLGQWETKLHSDVAAAQKAESARQAALANDQTRIDALRAELGELEGVAELQDFGYYEPQFDFEDSERFKVEIKNVRAEAKELIKRERAWEQPTGFTFNGSTAQGRRYMKAKAKLMLRAFNGEADAAIASVKHGNVAMLEKRLTKSIEGINKAGKQEGLFITRAYFVLKLRELHLTHEKEMKVHEEREEQRRIKAQMRDEAKAAQEIEKAKKAAEAEEARQEKALEQARKELADSTGRQHEKLEGLVARLENELKDALDKKAKAIARARLTKSGHVYVISNIGSFGEGTFKIGMTRRLEPLERVKELGDASVPFLFDVHAMIYSENAPELEKALHQAFDRRRVNRVNTRKEFFAISLEEIRREVARHHGVVTFVTVPAAEEYRRTVSIQEHERAEKKSA